MLVVRRIQHSQLKHSEDAIQQFKTLLIESVKKPEVNLYSSFLIINVSIIRMQIPYNDARKIFHADYRYESISHALSREERERLFAGHIQDVGSIACHRPL